MANASSKKLGAGAQGKGSGSGGMTDVVDGTLEENMVLSNRDKAQHGGGRGLDSKAVQNEQLHDHAGNRMSENAGGEPGAQGLGTGAPNTLASRADSSLKK